MLELYKRIRQRREELDMSQDELARKLGYKSRSSINKIEKGENDIPQSKIVAFAEALNTTPEYLMGWNSGGSRDNEELRLLNGYRELNADGKNLIMTMIRQLSFGRNSAGNDSVIQNISGNNNFLAVGNGNSYVNSASV